MGLNRPGLEAALGYKFRNPELLDRALVHSSKGGAGGRRSNERLEFLGDRVLGLVMAEMVFNSFPDEREGALARRYTALVCCDALARIAADIDLGTYLHMSEGEESSGGRDNPSIAADAMEAVIAALYLDGGLDAARSFIERHSTPLLSENAKPPKDAKTALQEWVQGRGLPLPVYEEVGRGGPAHAPVFEISVAVKGFGSAAARGNNKRAGEKLAAEKMLAAIKGKG